MTELAVCTSICANYLDKALTLADSVKRHVPNCKFFIGLVEDRLPEGFDPDDHPSLDGVVLARELFDPERFDAWIFRHTIVEASTAIKGALLRHLYQADPASGAVIYLDPDTRVYSPLTELYPLLSEHPIVLTPHLEVPGNLEMELSALKHGVFNLGFIAVSRHPEAARFLDWWADRLAFACFDDIGSGIFTDQKWVNLVPCFFRHHILRHPGYNFATWSLLDRELARDATDAYQVNGQPLRFAHFSGFDGGTFHKCIARWAPDNSALLTEFADRYRAECEAQRKRLPRNLAWSYARFRSGTPIMPRTRRAWRQCAAGDARNPFDLGNLAILAMHLAPHRLADRARGLLSAIAGRNV